jgi:beta-glucosidase
LPLTFPYAQEQLPPFEEYSMAGRTYRYATEDPQFPFGFGLSYTRFAYTDLRLPAVVQPGQPLPVQVTITNIGEVDGDEVVQLYLSKVAPEAGDPHHTLVGFQRITLAAGQSRSLDLTIAPALLASVDDAGRSAVQPGHYRLTVGASSPVPRSAALGAPAVSAEFAIG